MRTFTNTSDEARDIPNYSLFILPGADFSIPDEGADGLVDQGWCVEKTSKKSDTVAAPVVANVTVAAPVDAEQGVI